MKINDFIRELWGKGFFEDHRSSGMVKKELNEQYGINPSNVVMNLKSCKSFLRKESKGWIQKARFELVKKPEKSKIKNLSLLDVATDKKLIDSCKTMFEDKNYWKAVLHALIHLEVRIRNKSKLPASEYGQYLVEKAFKPNYGPLKIPCCATPGEEDGFKNIVKGMMMFHRNAKAHREETIDRALALKIIGYIDYLLAIIETAEQRNISRT